MRIKFASAVLCVATSAASTVAQPAEVAPNAPDVATEGAIPMPVALTPAPTEIKLDAYDAVREGNRLLRAGHANDALRLYEHADQLKPDAPEIAFAEGLSRYALGDYDQARESFRGVSLGQAGVLADDALYSEGASYHAEALGVMDNPQLALSYLENAMQRYQRVLKHRPDHEGAKDANYKAAHAWRQIKQMMQQQQPQQPSDKQNDKQEQHDQQQQQDGNEKQQSTQDQQQQSDQSEQQKNQQEQQQAHAEQEESKEQLPQPSQQEQDVSREQAERKLREMMQAQRQRQKNRKKHRALVPVRPTEKDW